MILSLISFFIMEYYIPPARRTTTGRTAAFSKVDWHKGKAHTHLQLTLGKWRLGLEGEARDIQADEDMIPHLRIALYSLIYLSIE